MTRKKGFFDDPFLKMALRFLALVLVLGLGAIFIHHKAHSILISTVEGIVGRQTRGVAIVVAEKLRNDLTLMQYAAAHIEKHPEVAEGVVETMYVRGSEHPESSVGFMAADLSPIVGRALSPQDFPQLAAAGSGEDLVNFVPGRGLLLTTAVRRGGNVRGFLWRLYDEEAMITNFKPDEYNFGYHFWITASGAETGASHKDCCREYVDFLEDEGARAAFGRVRGIMERTPAAALFYESAKGKFILFGSELPGTNCSIYGFVPWAVMEANVANFYMIGLQTGSIVLLLLALVCGYLFFVQSRADESETLRREKDVAARASQAKSAFLANMSHEIRTPINAILGMNEMILREATAPSVRRYAQQSSRAGEALLSIINDILDFSKIESGKIEIIEGSYRLSKLLRNVVAMIKPRADEKGLDFNLHIDENLPDVLLGDMMRIQQVIINILTNAVKYTPEGEVNFSVLSEKKEGSRLMLGFVVNDTGIGIKEEDQKKLFRDFERLDAEKNRNIEGTGLGLAITRSLVELMGGELSLRSIYGEGSTFTVILPQTILEDSPVGDIAREMQGDAPEHSEYLPSFTAPDARVLVVDDNEMNLLVVSSLLKATQIKLDTCQSGAECLERLRQERYDVVLLDHMMPEMDGVETLHFAQKIENARGVPFIVFTANVITGVRERFLKEGFVDYLPKPVEGEEIEKTLMKYIPEDKLIFGEPRPVSGPAGAEPPEAEADGGGSDDGEMTWEEYARQVMKTGDDGGEAGPPETGGAPETPAPEGAAAAVTEPLLDVALGMKYNG
ncbi:MAG: response regulator, partial [Oscillospiraceae bacterium]|nr:response regulator [Oscillospiraceae bacterium]